MKNPFKSKKEKFPTQQQPRQLKEIQNEYSQLAARVGQNQYQTSVLDAQTREMTDRMRLVNLEADQRNQLDAAAKKDAAAKAPEVESSQQ